MTQTGMDALRACNVSFAEIARQIGVTRGAVYQWEKIPAERVGEIARITGIPPHVQRPDLFLIDAGSPSGVAADPAASQAGIGQSFADLPPMTEAAG